jgi:hypothetical protein
MGEIMSDKDNGGNQCANTQLDASLHLHESSNGFTKSSSASGGIIHLTKVIKLRMQDLVEKSANNETFRIYHLILFHDFQTFLVV